MKKLRFIFALLAFALMAYSSGLRAEDTDIYVSNAANNGVPNVLFVIDNGADFSANASIGCAGYSDGSGAPSAGTDNTAGVLQCALVNAIKGLQVAAVNIGVMVSNANNFATTRPAGAVDDSKGGYHELCASGGNGGCLLRKLTLMDATGKTNLIKFIKGWQLTNTNGGNTTDQFIIKTNSSYQSETMQESWAYYNGKVGMSGTNYGTSILASGCQHNFVVYISNTQKDPNASEFNPAFAALSAPQVSATTAQLKGITGFVKFDPAVCSGNKAVTLYPLQLGNNWADEWARLMNQQSAGGIAGTQNITTYTIGIESSGSQCSADTFGMVASMGNVGGGGFYRVSSVQDLSDALNSVLNQVQAVNSVFSSASLPVSVNADGSYLNQIYLGMFRPDPKAAPRWLGNLKQYHLIKNSTGVLVQGDAQSPAKPAINPDTGFILPTALSFWTSQDLSKVPDSVGGFWVNAPDSQGVVQSGYDKPDGEVVEKGGVGQQLRLENLTGTFTGAQSSPTNPRRLYVSCPGGSCSYPNDLTTAANQFSTNNANIPTNAFGTDSIVPVASIVRGTSTAVVTTVGNHGFTNGTQVTIVGANQPEYNVTQSVTGVTSTTFTISGLPDNPTTPTTGSYAVNIPGAGTATVTQMVRQAAGSLNTVPVTVTTSTPHGFSTTTTVQITGPASPYSYVGTPSAVSSTTFTFNVSVFPVAPAVSAYQMAFNALTYPAQSVDLTNTASGEMTGITSTAHGLHVGQRVVIANANNKYNNGGNQLYYVIATVPSATKFTITGLSNFSGNARVTGTVQPYNLKQSITSLTRVENADYTAVAVASGLPSNWYGTAVGDVAVVDITAVSTPAPTNESAYAKTATATCLNAGCTQLSYTVAVTPPAPITFTSASVGVQGAVTNLTSPITRSGTTATVTLPTSGVYTDGQSLTISAQSGTTPPDSETAYLGTWKIACVSGTNCGKFTFTVAQTPQTPATGLNIQAIAPGVPPNRDTLIQWIRGQDNFGGEKGPGNGVTVRGSIHGDVLHSRPVVINYGGATGIVVYYGANDGVFRAVNGNQLTGAIGGVPPGGELWGLVFQEHFSQFPRQRLDTPELRFPTTGVRTARPKDYFADGVTGSFQQIKADGTIDKAYLFVTMRRGGRFLYAIDVSDPLKPTVMWKVDSTMTGYAQLGQTWSRPRVLKLQGGGLGFGTPVLVFGGGYDPAEDSEPPAGDSMGRSLFVVNALTGAIIWRANPTCTTSATCRNAPDMLYAIPSDIAAVDRDGDGLMDKFYFGDLGGNVWRADVAAPSTADWTVTKIASLGCDSGAPPAPPAAQTCPAAEGSRAPRKFFFAPAVLSIKAAGDPASYDAISIVSGDREHPLKSTDPSSSNFVRDKFFMIKDLGTTVLTNPTGYTPTTQNLTLTNLTDASAALIPDSTYQYDGSGNGFSMTFTAAEKGVNAPNATEGLVFFSTNRPIPPSATCKPNLGEAKAYAVSPFTGATTSNVLVGGGLPPSPVSGLIEIVNPDGTTSTEKFCIGCAAECTNCSALENSPPINAIPRNLKRTYWYKK